jgi:hypothetical protein
MREAGHVECVGEVTYVHSSSVGNPEGNRLFERPGQKWENDAKTSVDWIYLAQDMIQCRALLH